MNEWRRSGLWNPAFWYTLVGLALLAFSLWIPWLSALRTTRVESRADATAECLLEAASAFTPPLTEPDVQILMARFLMLAQAQRVFLNNLERVEPAPEGALLCLRNKHYAFQLTLSQLAAGERPGRNTVPALEVTAWPLSAVGPGHVVFFYPQDAERAFTRNLRAGYAGLAQDRPMPGQEHRRTGSSSRRPATYTGNDGERWMLY